MIFGSGCSISWWILISGWHGLCHCKNWLLWLIWSRECLERNFASDEVTVCIILHLKFIFFIWLLLFLINVVFLVKPRRFLKILCIYFKLPKWSIAFLLVPILTICVQIITSSLIETLTTDMCTDSWRLVSSLRVALQSLTSWSPERTGMRWSYIGLRWNCRLILFHESRNPSSFPQSAKRW